jgi:hypothetical protein
MEKELVRKKANQSEPISTRCWRISRVDTSPLPGSTCCRWSRRSSQCPSCCASIGRACPWLEGRLVITPHAAWLTPESEADTRRKSAETIRAALLTNRPQNVITPEMY